MPKQTIEIKTKFCKVCKIGFKPSNSLMKVCSPKCAYEYAKEHRSKTIAKNNKVELNKLKTKGELLKELQILFNRYIRLRDIGKPCIACGNPIKDGQTHASHYFSVGAYPNLRFNEDNCHSGCAECNTHLSGNLAEYALNLPNRIGQERFNQLLESRKNPLHLSKEEIEELKKVYKLKIKSL